MRFRDFCAYIEEGSISRMNELISKEKAEALLTIKLLALSGETLAE